MDYAVQFPPVPACPFVLIMAAPSAILLRASPRSLAPQTKGTVNLCLSIWCDSSAGVNTVDMKLQITFICWFNFHLRTRVLKGLRCTCKWNKINNYHIKIELLTLFSWDLQQFFLICISRNGTVLIKYLNMNFFLDLLLFSKINVIETCLI